MPGASAAGHHLMARMRTPLRVLALLGLSGSLAATNCEAQLADALCDPTQWSGDTCVIVGSPALPANAQLTFTAPSDGFYVIAATSGGAGTTGAYSFTIQ